MDAGNRPLNIRGRTGVTGRGVLGKWGPNHAADPIVTRWKHGEHGEALKDETTGKRILEFVCIQRKDTGIWAIPGGMVDPGEKASTAVKREFMEEALDSTGTAKDNIDELKEMVEKFFENGEEVSNKISLHRHCFHKGFQKFKAIKLEKMESCRSLKVPIFEDVYLFTFLNQFIFLNDIFYFILVYFEFLEFV